MKKETPRKKAMKKFQQNEISSDEKSELLAMFEKMKSKKMPKVQEVKTIDEKEQSKVNDEKNVSTEDEKDTRNDEKPKKMKLNLVEKSEKPIEVRRSNNEKNVTLMKKEAMKSSNLNENLNSKLDAGIKGQNPDEKRHFRTVTRLKNQFVRPCSPTTQPSKEMDKENISRRISSKTETGNNPHTNVSRVEIDENSSTRNDSRGKRKFDTMNSEKTSNKVHDLVGKFEVGKRTTGDKSQ